MSLIAIGFGTDARGVADVSVNINLQTPTNIFCSCCRRFWSEIDRSARLHEMFDCEMDLICDAISHIFL